jgi:hypothetical protein
MISVCRRRQSPRRQPCKTRISALQRVQVDRGVIQRRDLLARLEIAKPEDQPGKDTSLQKDARADGIVDHGDRSVTYTRRTCWNRLAWRARDHDRQRAASGSDRPRRADLYAALVVAQVAAPTDGIGGDALTAQRQAALRDEWWVDPTQARP